MQRTARLQTLLPEKITKTALRSSLFPEPGSLVLFGSGLAGLAKAVRWNQSV
jgi:hypothetical protein